MTSSGTTYCSSDTDESAATAVFVIGDELDNALNQLEVRTLGPIDEEDDETGSSKGIASEDDEQSSNSNATTENTCYRVATPKILSDEVVTYRSKRSSPESTTKRDSCATQQSSDRSSDQSAASTDHHADNEYSDDLPPKMPLIAVCSCVIRSGDTRVFRKPVAYLSAVRTFRWIALIAVQLILFPRPSDLHHVKRMVPCRQPT